MIILMSFELAKKRNSRILAFLLLFFIVSCGGGGGGSGDSGNLQPTNNPPRITNSVFNYQVNENQTAAFTVTATDPDNDSINFSISGGSDQELFSINQSGEVVFEQTPDYENPDDSDKNNIYEITISVTDGTNTDSKQFSVSIEDDESDNFEVGKTYIFDSDAKDHEIINYSGSNYLISFSERGYNDESCQDSCTQDSKNYLVNVYELPISQIHSGLPNPYKQQFYNIGDFCDNGCQNDFTGDLTGRAKLLKNFFNNEDAIVFRAKKRSETRKEKVIVVGVSHIIDDEIIFNDENWSNNFSSFEKIYVIEDTGSQNYFANYLEVGDFDSDGKDDLFVHRSNHVILSSDIDKYTDLNIIGSSYKLNFSTSFSWDLPVSSLNFSDKEDLLFVSRNMQCNYYSPLVDDQYAGNNRTNFIDGISLIGQVIKLPHEANYQNINTEVTYPSFDITDQQDCSPKESNQSEIIQSYWIFIKGIGLQDNGNFNYSAGDNSYKNIFTSDFYGDGNKIPIIIVSQPGPLTYDSSYNSPPYNPGKPKIIISHNQLAIGINTFDINNPNNSSIISFPTCVQISGARNLGDINNDGKDDIYVYLRNRGGTAYFEVNLVIKGMTSQEDLDLSEAINCSSMNYSDLTSHTILNSEERYSAAHVFSEIYNVVYDINGDSKLDILYQGKLITPYE
ncbi:cadherin repeat domain-containing protein [Gammaproteobacteria bacterium]|nr:cadherin repeat domain-containing protein [Gammaproteobacteria bacterium]